MSEGLQTKEPKKVVCKGCGEERQHHAHGYCRNCYMHKGFSSRRDGFCANPMCPNALEIVEIVGRGLCQTCYNKFSYAGTLEEWPLLREQS